MSSVKKKRERDDSPEAAPPHPLGAWEFYAQGTWHTSADGQSAAFDDKIGRGMCVLRRRSKGRARREEEEDGPPDPEGL
jgi:hypothetical protein